MCSFVVHAFQMFSCTQLCVYIVCLCSCPCVWCMYSVRVCMHECIALFMYSYCLPLIMSRIHAHTRARTHTHTHTGSDRASASHEAQVCASVCEDMRANRMRCNDKLNGLERFATQMHEEWKTLTFYFPGLTNWPVPENKKVNASRFLFGFHVYACACKARIMHTVILCNHAARED